MPVPGSGKKETRPDAVWCFMVSWLRQRRVVCAAETAAPLETIHEGIDALESYASECLTTYNLDCSIAHTCVSGHLTASVWRFVDSSKLTETPLYLKSLRCCRPGLLCGRNEGQETVTCESVGPK